MALAGPLNESKIRGDSPQPASAQAWRVEFRPQPGDCWQEGTVYQEGNPQILTGKDKGPQAGVAEGGGPVILSLPSPHPQERHTQGW